VSVEHRFKAELEAARSGGAVVLVPAEIATALGGMKQMRVVGTVNGAPYQSSTMPYGGRGLFMGVHKATRDAAGVNVGDSVEVVVARDERPRVLEISPELESAFAAEPWLRTPFDALSFSRRRDLAGPISEAKRPETRAARLANALARLRELG
jgi:bifunctional DNA-binding transcriptional regulator/antitoxin component of YhaV-PrlF toxin-antitoxin module